MMSVEYIASNGQNPYANWFNSIDAVAAAKVRANIIRLENGNFSNVKGVGKGVSECKVDFGPGYRVYFGQEGNKLIILLGGGTKKRQQNDIHNAQRLWQEYKDRKNKEQKKE